MRHDRFRPAAAVRMAARVAPGRIDALLVKIAAPAPTLEMEARLLDGATAHEAMVKAEGRTTPAAVAGGLPPYAIPNFALDHHPAKIGIPTGDWRGRGYGVTCFATECFVDEIAKLEGIEPFSFRMGLLGSNPRLAQCLTKVAQLGGWNGGAPGTAQGLAAFQMVGSCIAVMAEARIGEDGRVRVDRLVAVADVGQVINPDIVRQQIGGGLIFGMSAATGAPVTVTRGLAGPTKLGALGLPRLADAPRITIELVTSVLPAGGAGELAVPPVAPAIANALFASAGKRYRQLPLLAPSDTD
jgi:isoquinoline 1-oxidoreductase subunit beta